MAKTLTTRPAACRAVQKCARKATESPAHSTDARVARGFDNSLSQWFSGANNLWHPTTSAFSVSAWVYPTNTDSTNAHGIIKCTTNTGAIGDFMLSMSGNGAQFNFYLWENTGTDADGRHDYTTVITLNTWNHIVVTVTAAPTRTITLYHNNFTVSSVGTASTAVGWSNESAIGTNWTGDGTYDFGGRQMGHGIWIGRVLDAVSVNQLFNGGKARLHAEIANTALATNLSSYYDGSEETAGDNLLDQAGSDTLTANGTPDAGLAGPGS